MAGAKMTLAKKLAMAKQVEEGRAARNAGGAEELNPYPRRTDEHAAFAWGWCNPKAKARR